MAVLTVLDVSATSPSPSVRIDVDGLPGSASVTVLRLLPGGEGTVRGALNKVVGGSFTVTDNEAPQGIPVTYRAAVSVGGGPPVFTNSVSITLGYTPGRMWLSDPLVPANAIQVIAEENAAHQPTYDMDQTIHRVGLRTVALVGIPGLLTGLPLNLVTLNRADRDTVLRIILESGGLVLFRTPPEMPIPSLIYCAAAAVPLDYVFGDQVRSRWTVKANEVSPSPLDIAVPLVTYQMYNDAFPTYGDFNAAYSTYIDALRNPPGD